MKFIYFFVLSTFLISTTFSDTLKTQSFSGYEKCIKVKKELIEKHSHPDKVITGGKFKIYHWHKDDKKIVFKHTHPSHCRITVVE